MGLLTLIKTPTPPGVGASCLRKRFPHHSCEACRAACPVEAISFSANVAELDHERCIRCGQCLFVCPVDAFENLSPVRRPFRHTSLIAPFSTLVPSVEELLMWHLQYGIRAVEIDIDEHPGWALSVAAVNMQLKKRGEPLWQLTPSSTTPVNTRRRHMLHVSESQVQSAAVKASPRLRRRHWKNVQEYALSLEPATCLLCGACERVCEEKVIKLAKQEMRVVASLCSGCDSCAVVCPTKSISIRAETGTHQPWSLPFVRKVCASCKGEFATFSDGDKHCPICQRHKYGMRGR